MKKILVPCDFYSPSNEAFKFAVDIANKLGGEVFVLNVNELPVIYEPALGLPNYAFDKELLIEMKTDVDVKYANLLAKNSVDEKMVSLISETGELLDVIAETVDREGIDLVIMGTHGSRGWMEPFLGSTTEKVVRHSSVPVLALRRAPSVDKIHNIVFPLVPQVSDTHAVNEIKALQKLFSAVLHIVFINTPNNFVSTQQAMNALNKFVALHNFENTTLNIYNDVTEESGIINYTAAVKGDLLAMFTHGRKGLAHLFHHSVTEEVLASIDFPIWTYRINHNKQK